MSITHANPYLILKGRALEAIETYRSALGAEVGSLIRFGDMDDTCPEAMKGQIMHGELLIGDSMIMLSDGPGCLEEDKSAGDNNVSVALAFADEQALRDAFAGLSASGAVINEPFSAPWGSLFGAVRDQFGIHWMLNGPIAAQAAP